MVLSPNRANMLGHYTDTKQNGMRTATKEMYQARFNLLSKTSAIFLKAS